MTTGYVYVFNQVLSVTLISYPDFPHLYLPMGFRNAGLLISATPSHLQTSSQPGDYNDSFSFFFFFSSVNGPPSHESYLSSGERKV